MVDVTVEYFGTQSPPVDLRWEGGLVTHELVSLGSLQKERVTNKM